eukprot:CAMPEP_0115484654 /NCGR_PEP_ID=MMETSP0271-20121206/59494_1 /TAXON_ID=71861 /ORGANISM="Scrippsiella trochoidea, Strain CCMP3099" /LENGTH=80 /DNA_ID=CAMNT_0002912565 /DNA_START=279 /DNA_END=518 /DNA_ORIENTATION=+
MGPCALAHADAQGWNAASMVEEPQVGECHGHAVGVARLDHLLVGVGTARLGDVLDTELLGMVNGVPKWEEGVGGDGDVAQ